MQVFPWTLTLNLQSNQNHKILMVQVYNFQHIQIHSNRPFNWFPLETLWQGYVNQDYEVLADLISVNYNQVKCDFEITLWSLLNFVNIFPVPVQGRQLLLQCKNCLFIHQNRKSRHVHFNIVWFKAFQFRTSAVVFRLTSGHERKHVSMQKVNQCSRACFSLQQENQDYFFVYKMCKYCGVFVKWIALFFIHSGS